MCQSAFINCVFTHSVPIGTFSPQNYTVREGGVANLMIVLDRPSVQDTIFNVATMNLTATSERNIGACYATVVCYQHYFVSSTTNPFPALAFDDYFRHNYNVTVPAGAMEATTTVVTQSNTNIEVDEYFKAVLHPFAECNNLEVGVDTAYVTIIDCTGERVYKLINHFGKYLLFCYICV